MNHQQEIPPELKNALDSLRAVPARDRRIAARRRQDYLDLVEELPVRGWLRLFQPLPRLAWLAAAVLLLAVLLTGTTLTALAAQDSLPGGPLYSLKPGLEDVQLALSPDAAGQFNLLQQFTARRFAEMDTLLADNTELPLALAERLEAQFERMYRLAAGMDDPSLAQALSGLHEMLQTREQLMTAAAGQPADPVYARIRQRVQEMNQLAAAGLADPDQFRWQFEHQNGGTGTPVPSCTPGNGPGPGAGPGPGEPPTQAPTPAPTSAPGNGPGPGAGPGPGEPPTQAPAPSQTPAPTQGEPNATPTSGNGQGPGGTPTEEPAPTQGGNGATPTPGGGQGPGSPTSAPGGNGGGHP